MSKRTWNISQFKKAVQVSKSITEVLSKLNLRAAGGNFGTINKYISKLKLNTDHFCASELRKRTGTSLKEILVKDSSYTNMACLKKRMFAEGLKNNQCEFCEQTEDWRGSRMSMILDHENGNHQDHRLCNLRILCPNCNATLPTHCGKNIPE